MQTFVKASKQANAAAKVSYIVRQLIAKRLKPFSDGEFMKECTDAVIDCMCPEKKQFFANINLS